MEPRSKWDRLVLAERLVEAGLTLIVEAQQLADNEFARARRVRNGLMIALLAVCPSRLKNFSTLEIGYTFKHVHGSWWIAVPGALLSRRASRPGMVEQRHRPVSAPIATRSSSLWGHDECPLDIFHDRPTNDHNKPRCFGVQGHS